MLKVAWTFRKLPRNFWEYVVVLWGGATKLFLDNSFKFCWGRMWSDLRTTYRLSPVGNGPDEPVKTPVRCWPQISDWWWPSRPEGGSEGAPVCVLPKPISLQHFVLKSSRYPFLFGWVVQHSPAWSPWQSKREAEPQRVTWSPHGGAGMNHG